MKFFFTLELRYHRQISDILITWHDVFDEMQRLRVYQQRCEAFETMIYSYSSCPYAWDEPCYPHRLTVEVWSTFDSWMTSGGRTWVIFLEICKVPGERVVGSYTLDDVKDYTPVCLSATSEVPSDVCYNYLNWTSLCIDNNIERKEMLQKLCHTKWKVSHKSQA